MQRDTSGWSGEGEFTQVLVDVLATVPEIAFVRVEDAPATRSDADYNFISNEIYVGFHREPRREPGRRFGVLPGRRVLVGLMTLADLQARLETMDAIGPPDYADDGMLQFLRSERIVPPYQTKGYKLVELVRVYEAAPVQP